MCGLIWPGVEVEAVLVEVVVGAEAAVVAMTGIEGTEEIEAIEVIVGTEEIEAIEAIEAIVGNEEIEATVVVEVVVQEAEATKEKNAVATEIVTAHLEKTSASPTPFSAAI